MGTRQRVMQDILKRQGLRRGGHGRIVKDEPVPEDTEGRLGLPKGVEGKTPAMMLLEAALGEPIEKILIHGSLNDIAKRTGFTKSAISKWRKRLGLR